MRKTAFWAAVGVMLVGILGSATFALAHGFKKDVRGDLNGYNETPATLSTSGYGSFKAKIDDKADKIEYTLKYNDLEGDVTQAHIHFGRPALSGGISAWLCGTPAPGPTGPGRNPDLPRATRRNGERHAHARQRCRSRRARHRGRRVR